jgi:uncharacterized protein
MKAGTSTARISVASTMTARAMPMPSCWRNTTLPVAYAANEAAMMAAAAVTSGALRAMPRPTDRTGSRERSYARRVVAGAAVLRRAGNARTDRGRADLHRARPRRRGRAGRDATFLAEEAAMSHFLYKFVPRPDFRTTMTEAELAIMREHVAYWQTLADKGIAVAFGPVADPAGDWGVAIVEADSEEEVQAIRAADPVVTSSLGPVDVYPMPSAITRRWQPDPA